ncbi:N-acyl homoserine lactonase family protein [Nocardia gamkensis]|uniref:N-acyl homoserine lactonase family protein n=1 Tax=Nocardia gamkensis TaxID=352869 RepID=UPI0033C457AE
MKIHPLQTGTAELKHSFLRPRPGILGRIRLLLPDAWHAPVPLGGWLIEHEGRRILVDTGETAGVKDLPFARYHVTPEDELPHALAAIGLTTADIDLAIVTHLHSDHVDGAVHLRTPVLVAQPEWDYAHSLLGRIAQRISRAQLPTTVEFQTYALSDGPFGAFQASKRLTDDGRIIAVATPGHTPGHVSVIAIDDNGHHIFLAGDATDSLEQLRSRRPDAIGPNPRQMIDTMDRILAHAELFPTVYIPAHDPESVIRLATRSTL